jgi:hypothetical protein
MRNREDEAEEDGQAVALEIVVDDEADRVLRRGLSGCGLYAPILTSVQEP